MSNNNITSTKVTVDANVARNFLAKNTHNRPKRKDHIFKLKKDMLEVDPKHGGKKFKDCVQPIKIDKNGRLMDGQHRCEAIIEADKVEPGISFDFFVEEGHEPETVETLDNGAKQRNLFDNLSYHIDTKKHPKYYKKLCADVEKMYGGIGNLKTSERASPSEKVEHILNNESILEETNKIFEVPKGEIPNGFNEAHYRAAFHSYIAEDPSNTDMYRTFAKQLVGKSDVPGLSKQDPLDALKRKITELEAEHLKVGSRIHSHTRMAYTLQAIEDQKNNVNASKKSYELKPAKYHSFSKTKYSIDKDKES